LLSGRVYHDSSSALALDDGVSGSLLQTQDLQSHKKVVKSVADHPFPTASIHLKTLRDLAPMPFAAFYAKFTFASRDSKRGSAR
jgi:hypothetical protein